MHPYPRMHGEELSRAVERISLDVVQCATDAALQYGKFKHMASEAVRVADMHTIVTSVRNTRQSTLQK
jgi:hypothetical protein